jgi:hypothetical protein
MLKEERTCVLGYVVSPAAKISSDLCCRTIRLRVTRDAPWATGSSFERLSQIWRLPKKHMRWQSMYIYDDNEKLP